MRATWIIAALSAVGVAAGAAAMVIGPISGESGRSDGEVVELSWDDLIPEEERIATRLAMEALKAEAAQRMSSVASSIAPPIRSGPVSPLTGQPSAPPPAAAPAAPGEPPLAASAAPAPDERGLRGVIQHSAAAQMSTKPGDGLVRDFDGQRVRLPGYIVPLDFDGERTSKFLLVPFIGACVHVPPPPANQIVYVETAEPYAIGGFFEAVYAEGVMTSDVEATELAEVGYRLSAESIWRYQ